SGLTCGSMTPASPDGRFDATAAGGDPFVPVMMQNAQSFFTLATKTGRKFIACRTCEVLKMGVNESMNTVTGPLAPLTLLLTWMLTSVKSMGSLIDVSPPTRAE